jgi:diadenosine tetraphosphate (Ap4A) HIT family hydrolase
VGDVGCPFCNPSAGDVIAENNLCYARYDSYPVSPGHLLIIPFRHVAGFFDATDEEQQALLSLIRDCRRLLDERFHPDGYNIGVNVGEAAGQTVMHLHVHLIPRYSGDVENPRGGVRGVIPEKRIY